jgi:hypothetical protein
MRWDDNYCKLLPGAEPVTYVNCSTTDCRAFVAVYPKRQSIVVTFSGSASLQNFQVPYFSRRVYNLFGVQTRASTVIRCSKVETTCGRVASIPKEFILTFDHLEQNWLRLEARAASLWHQLGS